MGVRAESEGEEVDCGWRSENICQADPMGLGGGCIAGQVLHVKNNQQGNILYHKIKAAESFVNEVHLKCKCERFKITST